LDSGELGRIPVNPDNYVRIVIGLWEVHHSARTSCADQYDGPGDQFTQL
jgi:hypothetical protein